MRTTPVTPAPPTASVTGPSVDSRSRNKFIWCTEPFEEAAKNNRSVTSHARKEIGWGNWKVVRSDRDDKSHNYYKLQHWQRKELYIGNQTLTEWSTDEVNIRHSGKRPMPQRMSVTGRVWSDSEQKGNTCSFCSSSSSNLSSVRSAEYDAERQGHIDLDTDQTLTLESSLPEINAQPSFVKRRTLSRR